MASLVLSLKGLPQEGDFLAALAKGGVDHLVIGHLYYLTPQSEAVKRMKELPAETVFCSWLNERAALWVLKSLGVEEKWQIKDLAQIDDFAAFVASLPKGKGKKEELVEKLAERWYPVIDYERCTSCQQCLEFCLFGVYEPAAGRIVVKNPEKCKPGCPACARVCAQKAVMFPHYEQDQEIAGVLSKVPAKATCSCSCSSPKKESIDDLISDLDELDL